MKLVSKRSVGVAGAIVIVAVFGFFYGQIGALDRNLLEAIASPLDERPEALLLELRRGTRVPPDLLPFLLPRTEDGNAATFIFDVAGFTDPTELNALEQLYERTKEKEDLNPRRRGVVGESNIRPSARALCDGRPPKRLRQHRYEDKSGRQPSRTEIGRRASS